MSDDIVARMKSWDRCWPGNTNVERLIDDAADEIERLRAAMSRCLLGDPPGDCYAAETVTLRARVAAFEKDISDAAGLLMVDVPEPGTPMAKVMQANAIMRWDRDAARARVAKLEAVQFAAKAYLDAALQHDSANAALAKRVAELEAERAILLPFVEDLAQSSVGGSGQVLGMKFCRSDAQDALIAIAKGGAS